MSDAIPFKIKYEVYPEDDFFVARCLDLDVSTDGATEAEALDNLRLALELYVERHAELLLPAANDEDGDEEEDDAEDESY